MADRRFDAGRLGKAERTPQGGARVPASLTRTGVLVYRNADGSSRREYRPAEEVFRADSLATLRSAPVTDGAHVWVTPKNWRDVSCGHVESPRQDEREKDLLISDLVLQDGTVLGDVDAGKRADISCGYTVDFDPTPGVTPEGEPYDGVQRNIRYNHVTLLGAGQGRAGARAGLRLDSSDFFLDDAPDARLDSNPAAPAGNKPGAPRKERPMKIRFDGKEYDVTKPDEAVAFQNAVAAKDKAFEAEKARADQAEADLKKARTDADDTARFDAAVTERVELLKTASELLGADYSDKRADGKSKANREVMLDVIRGDDKDFSEKDPRTGKDRTDEYVRARFDSISEKGVRTDSIQRVTSAIRDAQGGPKGGSSERRDSKREDEDPNGVPDPKAARQEMIERNRKAGA